MPDDVIMRRPGEDKTWLVGGGDYVTMKTRGAEVGEQLCAFEVASTPGFGPAPSGFCASSGLVFVHTLLSSLGSCTWSPPLRYAAVGTFSGTPEVAMRSR